MPSFFTKVFGRKKDDKDDDSRTSDSELLGGKFEDVSPNVSPTVTEFPELNGKTNGLGKEKEGERARGKEKESSFTTFFRSKSRPSSPVRTHRKLDELPHLSLNFFIDPKSDPPPVLDDSELLLTDIAIGERQLTPVEAISLIRGCSQAITVRGIDTLGVMHPHWYSASPDIQQRLISLFIHSLSAGSPLSTLPSFASEINSTRSPHDVAAVLRWGLRHLQLEGNGFGKDEGWYQAFFEAERKAVYPPKAFSETLAPLLPAHHLELLKEVLEIFSSLAAHAEANGTSGSKLSKVFGLWLLAARRVEAEDDWLSFYDRWERTGRMLEHLFFARIRDEAVDSRMPVRLLELVHKYPYYHNLASPAVDLQLLPRPRFTTRLHEALFVRLETELPNADLRPKSKIHPTRLISEAFSTTVEGVEFADLWTKITTASKAEDSGSPLTRVFADETIKFFSLVPLEENGEGDIKSPTFTLLPLSPASPSHRRSFSLVDMVEEIKRANSEGSTSGVQSKPVELTPLSPISTDWTLFSASGFGNNTPPLVPLSSTLFRTDVEKTTPSPASPSRRPGKHAKSASASSAVGGRKSLDLDRSVVIAEAETPIAENVLNDTTEEAIKLSSKISGLKLVQLDEAFIDFWNDALLDPISANWPTFVVCKLKPSLASELSYGKSEEGEGDGDGDGSRPKKNLGWLVVEQSFTVKPIAPPVPRPIIEAQERPLSSGGQSTGKKRFAFWSVSRSSSASSVGSQKNKKKEKGVRVTEMGEVLEESVDDTPTGTEKSTVMATSPKRESVDASRKSLDVSRMSLDATARKPVEKPIEEVTAENEGLGTPVIAGVLAAGTAVAVTATKSEENSETPQSNESKESANLLQVAEDPAIGIITETPAPAAEILVKIEDHVDAEPVKQADHRTPIVEELPVHDAIEPDTTTVEQSSAPLPESSVLSQTADVLPIKETEGNLVKPEDEGPQTQSLPEAAAEMADKGIPIEPEVTVDTQTLPPLASTDDGAKAPAKSFAVDVVDEPEISALPEAVENREIVEPDVSAIPVPLPEPYTLNDTVEIAPIEVEGNVIGSDAEIRSNATIDSQGLPVLSATIADDPEVDAESTPVYSIVKFDHPALALKPKAEVYPVLDVLAQASTDRPPQIEPTTRQIQSSIMNEPILEEFAEFIPEDAIVAEGPSTSGESGFSVEAPVVETAAEPQEDEHDAEGLVVEEVPVTGSSSIAEPLAREETTTEFAFEDAPTSFEILRETISPPATVADSFVGGELVSISQLDEIPIASQVHESSGKDDTESEEAASTIFAAATLPPVEQPALSIELLDSSPESPEGVLVSSAVSPIEESLISHKPSTPPVATQDGTTEAEGFENAVVGDVPVIAIPDVSVEIEAAFRTDSEEIVPLQVETEDVTPATIIEQKDLKSAPFDEEDITELADNSASETGAGHPLVLETAIDERESAASAIESTFTPIGETVSVSETQSQEIASVEEGDITEAAAEHDDATLGTETDAVPQSVIEEVSLSNVEVASADYDAVAARAVTEELVLLSNGETESEPSGDESLIKTAGSLDTNLVDDERLDNSESATGFASEEVPITVTTVVECEVEPAVRTESAADESNAEPPTENAIAAESEVPEVEVVSVEQVPAAVDVPDAEEVHGEEGPITKANATDSKPNIQEPRAIEEGQTTEEVPVEPVPLVVAEEELEDVGKTPVEEEISLEREEVGEATLAIGNVEDVAEKEGDLDIREAPSAQEVVVTEETVAADGVEAEALEQVDPAAVAEDAPVAETETDIAHNEDLVIETEAPSQTKVIEDAEGSAVRGVHVEESFTAEKTDGKEAELAVAEKDNVEDTLVAEEVPITKDSIVEDSPLAEEPIVKEAPIPAEPAIGEEVPAVEVEPAKEEANVVVEALIADLPVNEEVIAVGKALETKEEEPPVAEEQASIPEVASAEEEPVTRKAVVAEETVVLEEVDRLLEFPVVEAEAVAEEPIARDAAVVDTAIPDPSINDVPVGGELYITRGERVAETEQPAEQLATSGKAVLPHSEVSTLQESPTTEASASIIREPEVLLPISEPSNGSTSETAITISEAPVAEEEEAEKSSSAEPLTAVEGVPVVEDHVADIEEVIKETAVTQEAIIVDAAPVVNEGVAVSEEISVAEEPLVAEEVAAVDDSVAKVAAVSLETSEMEDVIVPESPKVQQRGLVAKAATEDVVYEAETISENVSEVETATAAGSPVAGVAQPIVDEQSPTEIAILSNEVPFDVVDTEPSLVEQTLPIMKEDYIAEVEESITPVEESHIIEESPTLSAKVLAEEASGVKELSIPEATILVKEAAIEELPIAEPTKVADGLTIGEGSPISGVFAAEVTVVEEPLVTDANFVEEQSGVEVVAAADEVSPEVVAPLPESLAVVDSELDAKDESFPQEVVIEEEAPLAEVVLANESTLEKESVPFADEQPAVEVVVPSQETSGAEVVADVAQEHLIVNEESAVDEVALPEESASLEFPDETAVVEQLPIPEATATAEEVIVEELPSSDANSGIEEPTAVGGLLKPDGAAPAEELVVVEEAPTPVKAPSEELAVVEVPPIHEVATAEEPTSVEVESTIHTEEPPTSTLEAVSAEEPSVVEETFIPEANTITNELVIADGEESHIPEAAIHSEEPTFVEEDSAIPEATTFAEERTLVEELPIPEATTVPEDSLTVDESPSFAKQLDIVDESSIPEAATVAEGGDPLIPEARGEPVIVGEAPIPEVAAVTVEDPAIQGVTAAPAEEPSILDESIIPEAATSAEGAIVVEESPISEATIVTEEPTLVEESFISALRPTAEPTIIKEASTPEATPVEESPSVVEESSTPEATIAADELVIVDEWPIPEEPKATEELVTLDESLIPEATSVAEEPAFVTPIPDVNTVAEGSVTVKDLVIPEATEVTEESVTVEDPAIPEAATAAEDSLTVDKRPIPEATTVAEEPAIVDEAPIPESTAAVDELVIVNELPIPDATVVREESVNIVDEPPTPEATSVTEQPVIVDESPILEATAVAEELVALDESPITEANTVAKEPVAIDELIIPDEPKAAVESDTADESSTPETIIAAEDSVIVDESPILEATEAAEELVTVEDLAIPETTTVAEEPIIIDESPIPAATKVAEEVVTVDNVPIPTKSAEESDTVEDLLIPEVTAIPAEGLTIVDEPTIPDATATAEEPTAAELTVAEEPVIVEEMPIADPHLDKELIGEETKIVEDEAVADKEQTEVEEEALTPDEVPAATEEPAVEPDVAGSEFIIHNAPAIVGSDEAVEPVLEVEVPEVGDATSSVSEVEPLKVSAEDESSNEVDSAPLPIAAPLVDPAEVEEVAPATQEPAEPVLEVEVPLTLPEVDNGTSSVPAVEELEISAEDESGVEVPPVPIAAPVAEPHSEAEIAAPLVDEPLSVPELSATTVIEDEHDLPAEIENSAPATEEPIKPALEAEVSLSLPEVDNVTSSVPEIEPLKVSVEDESSTGEDISPVAIPAPLAELPSDADTEATALLVDGTLLIPEPSAATTTEGEHDLLAEIEEPAPATEELAELALEAKVPLSLPEVVNVVSSVPKLEPLKVPEEEDSSIGVELLPVPIAASVAEPPAEAETEATYITVPLIEETLAIPEPSVATAIADEHDLPVEIEKVIDVGSTPSAEALLDAIQAVIPESDPANGHSVKETLEGVEVKEEIIEEPAALNGNGNGHHHRDSSDVTKADNTILEIPTAESATVEDKEIVQEDVIVKDDVLPIPIISSPQTSAAPTET